MSLLSRFKSLYLKIGVHTAPPGTLLHFVHTRVFRAYVAVAIATGYQKRLLLRRGELNAVQQMTVWRAPQRNADGARRILLMKLDHIGDFVIALPAFRLMRDAFPQAEITLLCGRWNRELALGCGLFDRVVEADVFAEISGESGGLVLSREVLSALGALPAFDVAVDLKVESDTRGVLNYIRAAYKAGYESTAGRFDMALSLPPPPLVPWNQPEKEHSTRRLLYMLASGVVADFHAEPAVRQSLAVVADGAGKPPALNGLRPPVVGINTGSGTETKKWPLERFAALADRLIRANGATVVLFGSSRESADAARLVSQLGSDRLIDRTGGLTLPEFIAALDRLDLFVGNDTGTTHLAAGMGVPAICLFSGVSDLGRFAPAGGNVAVLARAVPCAPCSLRKIEECPRDHLCMRSLMVEDVAAEAERILGALKRTVTAA